MGLIPSFFYLIYFCSMITIIDSLRFNVRYTDEVNQINSQNVFRHTCLYAVSDSYMHNPSSAEEIIPYCISEWQSEWNMKINTRDRRFTFAELRTQNITSEQLYLWSAPMDLIERYQFFLDNPTTLNVIENDIHYYNCSYPWFGPMCEYTFDQYDSDNSSFADIVHSFYNLTKTNNLLTCYEHLQCDRGGSLPCLHWTEICNGDIDCLNGGPDEENCWQLEIVECQETEFRCLIGECIDGSFFHDDENTPDCGDASDEPQELYKDSFCNGVEPNIFCEDIKFITYHTSEGIVFVWSRIDNRKSIVNKAMFAIKETSTSATCWVALFCSSNIEDFFRNISCKKLCLNGRCEQLIQRDCPPLIYLPSVPVLFNHVYFIYKKENAIYHPHIYGTPPDYVCYTQHLCEELPTTITLPSVHNATCRHFLEIPSFHGSFVIPKEFYRIVDRLRNVFWACKSMINTNNSSVLCDLPNMYRCANMSKCISIYRVNDGIRDCFYRDDEQQIMTAEQLNSLKPTKNWYKCQNLSISISSHLAGNRECHCAGICDNEYSDDEYYIKTHVSFQKICDRFPDLQPDSQKETDETNCDEWQCNNIYTYCDGIWNCYNGVDELGCNQYTPLNCKSNEHVCVSPTTYEFMCLPLNKAYNGIADCLGGTDEPQLCQRMDIYDERYFCVKDGLDCASLMTLCTESGRCDNNDHINFCMVNRTGIIHGHLCDNINALVRSAVENYLCQFLSFSESKRVYFALDKPTKSVEPFNTVQLKTNFIRSNSEFSEETLLKQQYHCHRGLPMRVLLGSNTNITRYTCLCPPSYYGNICQYQNQRVSVTLKLRAISDSWNISFAVIVSLVDDDEQIINLPEQIKQFTYIFAHDCQSKFHFTLLYSTRPKNLIKNYSIHIHIYEKNETLTYRSSWSIPILFPFLPVHRITRLLTIPTSDNSSRTCNSTQCVNGQCTRYIDSKMNETFCRCNSAWFGRFCTISHQCTCSNNSLCIGITAHNRSICSCPLNKFGPRCLLDRLTCQNSSCQNGGYCVPVDENLLSETTFKCICLSGFHGEKCEIKDIEIIISFQKDINLPQSILVHLIQVLEEEEPKRITTYKKIPPTRNSVIIKSSNPFHILIIEFVDNNYYLGIIQKTFNQSANIQRTINPSHRCLNISELFNETFNKLPSLHRLKYYHLPCRNNSLNLFCFFDERHICFCTQLGDQRLSNCMEFDHNMQLNCLGESVCENNAACYYDNPDCPKAALCQCQECYYGARCSLNTHGFGLSLDAILGYHIEPYTNAVHQPVVIQVSATLTMIMLVMGIINSILCMITFKNKKIRETGCAIYITCLSIVSLITMIIFALKFWILVLSQMASITNQSFLQIQCILVDFLARIGLSTDQWLTVCVAIERVITVIQGVKFNKNKSQQLAKWVILGVIISTTSSVIQEPINRRLIDDDDGNEKRTWCIIQYTGKTQTFNSIVHIFHVAAPCAINLISAFIIIIIVARQQAVVHTQQSYRKHLTKQFQHHKHLLIAPCVLVLLAIPRLVLAFSSGCMTSARNPWLFLVGYFISFIPPLVTFIIFVLPSETYRKAFSKSYQEYRQAIYRCISNQE